MFYENGLVKIEKIKYDRNDELIQNAMEKLYKLNTVYNVFEPIIGGNSSRAAPNSKEHFLGHWEEFRDYIDFIKPLIRKYFDIIGEKEDDYYVVDMWSNKYPPGTTLFRHRHPFKAPERPFELAKNDSVAVVLYLKKPENSGDLILELPDGSELTIVPDEGDIVIFQGALWHKVSKNESDGDKFTIILEMNLKPFVEPVELQIPLEQL